MKFEMPLAIFGSILGILLFFKPVSLTFHTQLGFIIALALLSCACYFIFGFLNTFLDWRVSRKHKGQS